MIRTRLRHATQALMMMATVATIAPYHAIRFVASSMERDCSPKKSKRVADFLMESLVNLVKNVRITADYEQRN
jgi:hypothetical protein